MNNHSAKRVQARTRVNAAAGPPRRMTEDPDLVSYLLLLRFGVKSQAHLSTPILNYASIAKVVKKPIQTVRTLILLGIEAI